MVAVCAAVYIFLHAWQNFARQPTFTTLHSVKHPIWRVPFPAVSVCSANKISRKAARLYAEELYVQHGISIQIVDIFIAFIIGVWYLQRSGSTQLHCRLAVRSNEISGPFD